MSITPISSELFTIFFKKEENNFLLHFTHLIRCKLQCILTYTHTMYPYLSLA